MAHFERLAIGENIPVGIHGLSGSFYSIDSTGKFLDLIGFGYWHDFLVSGSQLPPLWFITGSWGMRLVGYLFAPKTGDYKIYAFAKTACKVWIDDMFTEKISVGTGTEGSWQGQLTSGSHPIKIEHYYKKEGFMYDWSLAIGWDDPWTGAKTYPIPFLEIGPRKLETVAYVPYRKALPDGEVVEIDEVSIFLEGVNLVKKYCRVGTIPTIFMVNDEIVSGSCIKNEKGGCVNILFGIAGVD